MNTDIQQHPASELLNSFSQGALSAGLSVAIAAHMEWCPHCQQYTEELERGLARDWAAQNNGSAATAGDYAGLPEFIVQQPQLLSAGDQNNMPQDFYLQNQRMKIPRVLSKAAGRRLVWKKAGNGINQARLLLDRTVQCDFMYMNPGSKMPHHTHRGTEVTLVLDGSFHDEMGHYVPGDFIRRSSTDKHTPASDEGCLCFAVLDRPLTFTSGFARFLNPIQTLMFNR